MREEYKGLHVLFIAENLTVPFSRRTWEEARTIKAQGADVSVICPKMKGYEESYIEIEGIHIYRHPIYEAKTIFGYLLEYGGAIFWHLLLSLRIFFKKRFHVIHGCNPPDLIFITALFYKLFGVKFVYDHHDVSPELYLSKFNRKDILYHLMFFLEKCTFMTANYSIATNESYKAIAVGRGNMKPENVHIVRSGPELSRLKLQDPKDEYKRGRKYLVGYLGVISEVEGLDLLMESAAHIVKERDDVQFAIVGGGTELENNIQRCKEMNLETYFDFYGRVPDQLMIDVLNTTDVCVNPDRPGLMTNISTMNKVMEYMALKKPIVQYTLKEGEVSAKEASLYAKNTDPVDFANKITYLLDNPEVRERMGNFGYDRIINKLCWKHEKNNLIALYDQILREQNFKLKRNK